MLDLPLQLDSGSAEPLYLQMVRQIAGFIRSGRLSRGSKLPPTRQLAVACGVHRNTVISAYAELQAQGYTEAGPGRGTFVASRLPEDSFAAPMRPPRSSSAPLSHAPVAPASASSTAGPYSRLVQQLPGVMDLDSLLKARRATRVNFNSGVVALDLFPWETFRGVLSQVLGKQWRRLAEHDHPIGLESLREALSTLLFAHGVSADPGEIVITTGSQQAIDLLARLYLDPGDIVAVEDPGYQAARQRFALEGARIEPIPVDGEGMQIEPLEKLLRTTPVKLVYMTPNCQWPTCVHLSGERRQHLGELAERYDFLVIEDDYAAELRFRGPATSPLYMSLPPGRCLNLGSFSKSLLPGLRLGYAVAPAEVTRKLAALKLLTDAHSSLLVQAAVAEFIQLGHFETHLRKLRRECRLRLDALTTELAARVAGRLQWNEPDAGSNLWCHLLPQPGEPRPDAADFASWARERGLAFSPGQNYFSHPEDGRAALLLGFAAVPVHRAAEMAEQLADCLADYAADRVRRHQGGHPPELEASAVR